MHPFEGGYVKLIATLILDAFDYILLSGCHLKKQTDARRSWNTNNGGSFMMGFKLHEKSHPKKNEFLNPFYQRCIAGSDGLRRVKS